MKLMETQPINASPNDQIYTDGRSFRFPPEPGLSPAEREGYTLVSQWRTVVANSVDFLNHRLLTLPIFFQYTSYMFLIANQNGSHL